MGDVRITKIDISEILGYELTDKEKQDIANTILRETNPQKIRMKQLFKMLEYEQKILELEARIQKLEEQKK